MDAADPTTGAVRSRRPSTSVAPRTARNSSSWRNSSARATSQGPRRSNTIRKSQNGVDGDSDAPSINLNNGKDVESKATRGARSIVSVLFVLVFSFGLYYMHAINSIYYCSHDTPDITECVTCPPNGKCSYGTLTCSPAYILQASNSGKGEVCVRDEAAVRRSRDLLKQVASILADRYGVAACGAAPETASGPPASIDAEAAADLIARGSLHHLSMPAPTSDSSSSSSVSVEQLWSSLTLAEVLDLYPVKRDVDAAAVLKAELETATAPFAAAAADASDGGVTAATAVLQENRLVSVETRGETRLFAVSPHLPLTCRLRRNQHWILLGASVFIYMALWLRRMRRRALCRRSCLRAIEQATHVMPNGLVGGANAVQIHKTLSSSAAAQEGRRWGLKEVERACEELTKAASAGVQATTFLNDSAGGRTYWSSKLSRKLLAERSTPCASDREGEDEDGEEMDDAAGQEEDVEMLEPGKEVVNPYIKLDFNHAVGY